MFTIRRILALLSSILVYTPAALLLMFKAILFGLPGRLIARRSIPKKARELELHHKPSEYLREFGELKGRVRGYPVLVVPEDSTNPRITVSLRDGPKELEVELSRPRIRPGKKIVEFQTGSRRFNRVFRTRRVHRSALEGIEGNRDFPAGVLRFYSRWMFRIDSLRITGDEVDCRLKYGFLLFPHIPAWRLDALVNGLVDIAETIA